ncbi:S8 family peptidase [Dyadobacter sp. CY323]|uniref:S8 family peptidase n=1 Tax=Dyadobacter sp. CY323 TaxID=2907302 RepID=UPI001F30F3A4|nr:S8 family peptidase [Dyadobacter sp. CY323]MCE6991576.1 S8 family peptidase [Dyadobacter sp. CY323]
MMKTILLTLFNALLFFTDCFSQSNPRYLVLYKDKTGSPFSVEKPTEYLSERAINRRNRQNIAIIPRDFPVNPAYVTSVKQTGAKVIYSSKWFNGSIVEASDAQLAAIKKLAFYKGIELDLPVANLTSKSPGIERTVAIKDKFETVEDLDYGSMNAQLALMDVAELHKVQVRGDGMLIAVLDNGFNQADVVGYFKQLRDEKRIIDTHDFVSRDGNVYNDGSHGLNVLSTMAAYLPGTMIGVAFKAGYALYRTENDLGESPYEEITWLLAAERADSLGADVINSSLGYTTFDGEFDNAAYNHTYQDLDGKTTIISRAARFATRTGMIVTNSAGNSGNDPWRYIGAPADVDSVLTVGATRYDRSYAPLSSIGPNAAGQMKPDVSAVGSGTIVGTLAGTAASGSGTSFSAPLIAGLAAILWQAHPSLSAQQIIYVLKKSGHNAASPNEFIGYGVPSVVKAEQIIAEEFSPLGTENELIKTILLSPNPAVNEITLSIPQTLVGKKAALRIYGANGALHQNFSAQLNRQHIVNAGHLSSGLYLLNIQVENQERTLKFIKR